MNETIEEAKKLSLWGQYDKSWEWVLSRFPEGMLPRLTAEDIAALADAFMRSYADGWARR